MDQQANGLRPGATAELRQRFEAKVAARGRMNYGAALVLSAIVLIFALHPVFIPSDLQDAASLVPLAKDDLEARQKVWIAAVVVASPVLAFLIKLASDYGSRDRRPFESKASDPKYADLLIEAQKELDHLRKEISEADDIRHSLGLAQKSSRAAPVSPFSATTPSGDLLSGYTGRTEATRPRLPSNTGSLVCAVIGWAVGSFTILFGSAGALAGAKVYGAAAALPYLVMTLAGLVVLPPITKLLRSAVPAMRPVWVPPLMAGIIFVAGGILLGLMRSGIH